MKTATILGAGGRVGHAAALALAANGWTVRGVVRDAGRAALAPGIEPVSANAADRKSLIAACAGADVVVNALNPQYTEWEEKVLPMARNVLAAVEAAGATHMLPGNVYNFGREIGMGMAEDAPVSASTPKARIRIEMEDLFCDASARRGVRTIVLRAGDFYGGTKPGTWHDLMILAKLPKGVFVWPGPMDVPHAFAYLPDLGRAFAALAERRDQLSTFEAFHFEGHTLTGAQAMALAQEVVGRQLTHRGVPWTLLRAAGLFMPMMREVAAMSYLWRTPHSLDGSRLRTLLPALVQTEPLQAMRETIADLGLGAKNRRAA